MKKGSTRVPTVVAKPVSRKRKVAFSRVMNREYSEKHARIGRIIACRHTTV